MNTEFIDYLQQARTDFCLVAHKYSLREYNELRTAIDSLLIAYDQAFVALSKPLVMQVPPTEDEIRAAATDSTMHQTKTDRWAIDMMQLFYEKGARWAISKMSRGTTVASEGVEEANMCAGVPMDQCWWYDRDKRTCLIKCDQADRA